MEFKARVVEAPQVNGAVEVEEKLIADAEAKHEGEVVEEVVDKIAVDESGEVAEVTVADEDVSASPAEEPSISEDEVLSFLKNKYGREASTLDEFTTVAESSEDSVDLPEDVAAYFLLKEYFLDTETGLDADDVKDMLSEYEYDEDVDTDVDVRKVKRAKRKAIAKAKEHFSEQAKMYAEPSTGSGISSEDQEGLEAYRSSVSEAESSREANEARSTAFTEATDNFFSNDFKGFDFKVGDDVISFNAGTAEEVKNNQSTPMNFINKYMDDNGMINDAAGYHKALAAAMQPDKFAQFFYEQGQANAKGDVLRSTKNINMGTRKAPEVSTTGGMKIKAIPTSHGSGLRIKSRN